MNWISTRRKERTFQDDSLVGMMNISTTYKQWTNNIVLTFFRKFTYVSILLCLRIYVSFYTTLSQIYVLFWIVFMKIYIQLDFQLFEPLLIRIFRLFEVIFWFSFYNSLSYSNFSYSNIQLFELIFCPHGPDFTRLFEVIVGNRDFPLKTKFLNDKKQW